MSRHPYVLLAAAVMLVCGQIIFFKYTYLDDYTLFVSNASVFGNPQNLTRTFTEDFMKVVSGGYYYRPLATFSFMFNALATGANPLSFHLTDVLLHLVTTVVLFKFLADLTGRPRAALLGSLFFAMHPALLQTIAWIPARNDTMVALFSLVSVLAFHKIWTEPRIRNYFLHFGALMLALLTKELGALIPVVCAAYYFLIHPSLEGHSASRSGSETLQGRTTSSWSRERGKGRVKIMMIGCVWLVLITFWYFARNAFINEQGPGLPVMLSEVFTSFYAGLIYFGKVILPFNLSTYPVLSDSTLAFGFISLVLLALGFIFSPNKNYRLIFFGALWFGLFLFPSLVRPNPGADPELLEHRLYVPMIGIVIVIIQLTIPRFLAYGAVGLFVIINLTHARHYKDGMSYWAEAVRTSPHSALAHRQLGAMFDLAGDQNSAEREYTEAVKLDFLLPITHANLGLIYFDQKRWQEAENEFRYETAVNPEYDQGYFNLGNLYYYQGKLDLAKRYWDKTLEINPGNQDARHNLQILSGN